MKLTIPISLHDLEIIESFTEKEINGLSSKLKAIITSAVNDKKESDRDPNTVDWVDDNK